MLKKRQVTQGDGKCFSVNGLKVTKLSTIVPKLWPGSLVDLKYH